MTYVEYKQLNPFQRFAYNTKKFFCNIPHAVAHFFTALGKAIVKFFVGIGKGFANYGKTFVKGDWATKLSYLIFGVGDLSKGKFTKECRNGTYNINYSSYNFLCNLSLYCVS